jgi:DNA modification methylase
VSGGGEVQVTFEEWTRGRALPYVGTNAGAVELPFQAWRHFKEAFAPEIVAQAILESSIPVTKCLDPFDGSGTTGLACQFLGVHPILAEVNPYLADLITSKLTKYSSEHLVRDLSAIAGIAARSRVGATRVFKNAPPTFVEPGVNGRWIFDRSTADRIAVLLTAIASLRSVANRRLFKILLGGVLVEVSNVTVNGKGRRYRKSWQQRGKSSLSVDSLFFTAAQNAISDLHRFRERKSTEFDLIRGDCRKLLAKTTSYDLAVFSPPYPNSFDYTDVYNIELWTLGYLADFEDNRSLRTSTLSSHVQVGRQFAAAPEGSRLLRGAMKKLTEHRDGLWDKRIPEMVGGYFADLVSVLRHIHGSLRPGGDVWMVVGDSQADISQAPLCSCPERDPLPDRPTFPGDCLRPCRSASQGVRLLSFPINVEPNMSDLERTAAGLQWVLPGCGQRTLPRSITRVDDAGQGLLGFYKPPSLREQLANRADAPLRPSKGQKALPQAGLFGQ